MKRYLPWLVGAALATAGVVPSLGNASGFGLPGDLDATFSGDGLQLTDLGGSDIAADVATQADGKLVVGGSSAGNFALARYTTSGAPDPSFSGDGLVTTDFGGADAGQGVAVQADGRIVVAGRSGSDFAVARYTAAGAPDPSFSGDGVQTTDFGADDAGAAVAIQADGRIVVAGQSGTNVAVARYTAAGVLDPSFSGDGRLTTDFGGFDGGRDVAIGADGKIVVAGASDTSDDGTPIGDFALARYLGDGALDTSFSRDGRQTTDFGGTYDSGEGVAVLADGRIVVAGHGSAVDSIGSYFPSDFELARYDARGTLDPSFSGDGRQTTDFGGDEFGYGVALQPNGRIVAFGKAASAFALARYNADGSLDTGFAGDGRQTTEVTLLASNVVGVDGVLQADGKLVAVGASAGLGGITDFSLARYEGDTPDPNAPETLLTEGPSGPTNVTTPSFTFTAPAGSTFECKLDTPAGGGSYAACTSPQPYTTSENGAYAFSVRATRSGSTDESPATRTFTVDTVAPVARLLTGPPPAGEGLLRFTFDSNEPDTTFECRLDEVELPTSSYPCASPHTIGPVPNGSEYYFLLFPTDAAGNQGSTEIWPIFSVGGIPDTTLTGGPILGTVSDLTTQIAGAFSFTSLKAGSTFECKLDGPDTVTGDYAPCVSPTPYGPLVDGGYTFWVRVDRSRRDRGIARGAVLHGRHDRPADIDHGRSVREHERHVGGVLVRVDAASLVLLLQARRARRARQLLPVHLGRDGVHDDRERHLHVLRARHGRCGQRRRVARDAHVHRRRDARADAERDGDHGLADRVAHGDGDSRPDPDQRARRTHRVGPGDAVGLAVVGPRPGPVRARRGEGLRDVARRDRVQQRRRRRTQRGRPERDLDRPAQQRLVHAHAADPGAGRERRLRSRHGEPEPAHAAGLHRAGHRRPGDDRAQTGDPGHRSAANGDLQHGADVHAVDRDALTRRRGRNARPAATSPHTTTIGEQQRPRDGPGVPGRLGGGERRGRARRVGEQRDERDGRRQPERGGDIVHRRGHLPSLTWQQRRCVGDRARHRRSSARRGRRRTPLCRALRMALPVLWIV